MSRILVVDDDPAIRDFVEMALCGEGYEVLSAANGARALEIVERCPPDLILLDLRMPEMDGWTFAALFRQRFPAPRTPLVLFSATINHGLGQVDADAVLSKPFELQDLFDVVARLAPRGAPPRR